MKGTPLRSSRGISMKRDLVRASRGVQWFTWVPILIKLHWLSQCFDCSRRGAALATLRSCQAAKWQVRRLKAQSKIRELLQSLKARYPTASEQELANRFMEELRSDEALHKTVLEEMFHLMSKGLERAWPKT